MGKNPLRVSSTQCSAEPSPAPPHSEAVGATSLGTFKDTWDSQEGSSQEASLPTSSPTHQGQSSAPLYPWAGVGAGQGWEQAGRLGHLQFRPQGTSPRAGP